ncbi:MAG: DEAD/DEAH box helicase [Oligoflexia bacterium]|nr:DEAD/DEAH box helicase [Oligoflexia bacterium]
MSGFPPLRPFQREALTALENPCHAICVAPTGSGKSLIFETLARRRETRLLLVSPLIALARQQAARLRALGVRTSLGTGDPRDQPPDSDTGVWIVSPESLQNPFSLSVLSRWKPGILVVDECHCFWDWGEEFRPAFSVLPDLLQRTRSIERSLWLTATLPPDARQELRSRLPSPRIELGGFALPPGLALHFPRVPWVHRADALLSLFEGGAEAPLRGPGILFGSTRESTVRLARAVEKAGRRPLVYHAGLSSEERRAAERLIADARADVVVATSAFGMGMDHPHLRWVLLWQAPASPLALAQALGRAGRGPDARALTVAFWDDEDFRLQEWAAGASPRRRGELWALFQIFHESGCRAVTLGRYFNGSDAPDRVEDRLRCRRCDACGSSLR